MNKPTKEEYKEACERVEYCSNSIRLTNDKIEQVLDELCSLKSSLNTYREIYKEAREVKNVYEIYEELEKEKKDEKN